MKTRPSRLSTATLTPPGVVKTALPSPGHPFRVIGRAEDARGQPVTSGTCSFLSQIWLPLVMQCTPMSNSSLAVSSGQAEAAGGIFAVGDDQVDRVPVHQAVQFAWKPPGGRACR